MKRLVLRLSITAVFLACGVIAIAQSMKKTDTESPTPEGVAGAEDGGDKPSRLKDDGAPAKLKSDGIEDPKVRLAGATLGAAGASGGAYGGTGSESSGTGSSYGSGATYGGAAAQAASGDAGAKYGAAANYGQSTGSSYGAGSGDSVAAGSGSSYGAGTGSSYGAGGSTYGQTSGSGSTYGASGSPAGSSAADGKYGSGSSVSLSDDSPTGSVGDESGASGGEGGSAPAPIKVALADDTPAPMPESASAGGSTYGQTGSYGSQSGSGNQYGAKAAQVAGVAAGAAVGAAAATAGAAASTANSAIGATTDVVDTVTSGAGGSVAGGQYGAAGGAAGTSGTAGGQYGAAGGQYGAADATSGTAGGTAGGQYGAAAAAGAVGGAVSAASQPGYQTQVAATASAGVPGDEKLEGVQRPALSIEKIAPREVQVGLQAKFEIVVKNDGRGDALDVMIVDQVPEGAKLVSTNPQHQVGEDGSLIWQLGVIKAGDSRTIEVEILPTEERESIGSVARVLFEAQASSRSRSTKPQLVIESNTPDKVLVGDDATMEFTIINQGSGAARNVVLLEDVPEGFTHPAGKELEYEIGTIRPNERFPVRLKLRAEAPALGVINRLQVKGEGQAFAEKQVAIDIVAPQLAVQLQGPTLKYLNRRSKYKVAVANTGTAPERKVDVVVHLPKGVRFSESPKGEYDSRAHLVYWALDQLDPQQQEVFELTVEPVEIGAQRLTIDAQGSLSAKASGEWETKVEGLSELTFTVADTADPIEFGKDTTYEIEIQNIGTKSDTNINLVVGLPKGLSFKEAQGETRNLQVQESTDGQVIQFEPIAKMGPNDNAKYRIVVVGEVEGDYRIGVQVSSDEAKDPVTREESTKVYRAD